MHAPRIIHEDEAIIAVVKPAGIATANVPAGEASVFTQVRRMLEARGAGDRPFLGVVSRLDRPVSGVVVLAKTPAAAADLARQFRERTVEKTYVAVVEGRFPAPVDTWVEWTDHLERPHRGPSRPAAAGPETPEARLRARVLVRLGEVSLVELVPATGRRHQLRAQLAARGCPIVGDRLYGSRLPFTDGIALHAHVLTLSHPITRRRTMLTADPPPSWHARFPALLRHLPQGGEVDSVRHGPDGPRPSSDAG